MAPRSVWKGQLRLSLVSIPVELYSAVDRGSALSFRQIHAPSGKPVRHEKVVPGIGPVDADDIRKGYEVGEDDYVLLTDDDLAEVKLESRKTLELMQFVGACEIPPIYFDRPYYILPQDDLAEDAYRVVRDALQRTETVGLGQLAMRGKEHLVAVRPCDNALMLETLRYESEVRDAHDFFAKVSQKAADEEMVDVAAQIIGRKRKPFEADAFHDSYAEALRDLIDRRKGKRGGRVKVEDEGRGGGRPDNVVDLMSTLKQSLEKTGKGARGKASGSKSSASKSTSKASTSKSSGASGGSKGGASKARKSA